MKQKRIKRLFKENRESLAKCLVLIEELKKIIINIFNKSLKDYKMLYKNGLKRTKKEINRRNSNHRL